MAINFIKKEDLSHITRTTRQWETTIDRYEIIPKGVLCIELCNDKLTKIKIGNGHLIYEQLPYVSDVNLSDYYTKEETNNLLKHLKSIKIKGEASSLSDLPLHGNEDGDLWFIFKSDPDEHNRYDEYVWYKNKWELFGSSDIDLSEYAKKSYVDTHIQEVQDEITEIIESGYLHKHSNKDILDQTSAVYTVEKDNKLRDLHNYDDTELREKAHTHLNKNILDQTDAVYNRDKDDKLRDLHNYDDTDVKDRIYTLEGVAHSHSNQDILNRITAAFTKEQALQLLDCRDFEGTDGVHDGRHGFVPAPTKDDIGKVLGANGQWVAGGGGGGGDTITQGGGIEITTDAQTGVKTVSVNAGTGLSIDPDTGELYVTSTGGDSIDEGGGISIDTDPQTGVKTISVKVGDNLEVDQVTGELNVTGVDYEAGQGIHIGADYTLIEYIKNSGNYDQIILTDIIPLSTDKIELDLKFGIDTGLADNRRIIGAYFTNITPPEVLQIHIEAQSSANPKNIGFYNHFEWRSGIGSVPYIERPTDMDNTEANQRQILSINQTTGTWGNQSTNFSSVIDSSYGELTHPIAIFGCVSNDINSPFVSKQVSMYGVKIYNSSDVLIHDLRPAERGIDGEAGLYDLVTHKFYGNAGNGSFVKGPPVSSVDDRLISAKIGDGLQFDSNDAIEVNTGDGLSINHDNELELDKATKNSIGGVIVGDNIDVTNGTISVPEATDSSLGVVKPTDGLSIDNTGELSVNTGDGLSVNQDNELEVNIGQALSVNASNEIDVNVGNGLSVDATNNDINVNVGTGLQIDPLTNEIKSNYASRSTYGAVKVGQGVDVDENGIISVDAAPPFRAGEGIILQDEADRLPSGFSRIEYVAASSTNIAGTVISYVVNTNSRFVGRMSRTEGNTIAYGSSPGTVFGQAGRNYERFVFGYICDKNTSTPLYCGIDSSYTSADPWNVNKSSLITNFSLNDIVDFEMSLSEGLKLNNEVHQTFTSSGTIPIASKFGIMGFAYNNDTNIREHSCFFGRLYFLKIYEGDTLRFSFVPCIQTSSNTPGLYDTVGRTFYASTTGTPFLYDASTIGVEVPDWVLKADIATSSKLGSVKVGSGLSATNNGTLSVNTGDGLSINQDNELEVNIGTGLEIDPDTGAINVTGGSGDTVEAGDGIDIDTDSQTGNKVISVVTGNGLEINNDNEVEVNIGDGLTLDANEKITIDEDIVPLTHYFPGTAISFDQQYSAEVDIWNNGNGWANGAYTSSTGNSYLAGFNPEYHSPIGNNSLEVPTNVNRLRVIALSANDDVLSVTVHCLDASHNRYLTLYDDTQPYDDWIDLDASARYVNFGVRWTLNSNVGISATDIKSVTLYWQHSGSGDLDVDFMNINVNYGDGLTVNQDNELEVNIDAGDGIDITTDSQTGNKVISTIVQENGGLTIDEDTNGLKLDQSAAGKAINISDEITFDSWNNGTGWANEEYYDNTSDRHIPWNQNLMIYPTSTDVLFRIPDGVTQAKCSATSVSPSISLKTGLYFYNEQGAHFAGPTRSTDPDTIIDIPAGSVYVNQSIRKVNDRDIFSSNVTGATITWVTGGTKIDVKYGTGLALNQNNELEVNIGDGLEIDPDTGAINVTGGGGGGDSIAEGDGISITDDLQTGDKIISVNYGTGLTIDTETGALIVDGQLPEGTIIRKMTIMGDGGATNNIQFEKKPVAIMSIYGNGLGGNHISSTSAPIDSPILMGAYGAGGSSSGGIVSCAMSYNDSTNVLSLTGGPDAGARYNMANETYTVYYLTKGHTGEGTSETNEVSVIKTITYTGTGTATNILQFPETPDFILSINGMDGLSGDMEVLPFDPLHPTSASQYTYTYTSNSTPAGGNNSVGHGHGTYAFDTTTNTLTLTAIDQGAACNYLNRVYRLRYTINETISGGGGSGDSIDEGDGITITDDPITDHKIISVNVGEGLAIDPVTGALKVDTQLPEGTILKKLTYMGNGSTSANNIQFSKKPLAIMSIYGSSGTNYIASNPAPIDAPYLIGDYGGVNTNNTCNCAMSYNDTTNVLTLSPGYASSGDAGLLYNANGQTYTVWYLVKGHAGSGTSVNNEVSVVKTFSYVGTGTATNNIQFPETPDMVLSIYGPLGTGGNEIRTLAIDIAHPSANSKYFYEYWQNGSAHINVGTYSFNDTTNILSLVGIDYGASLNYSGLTYTVRYIVNEVIASSNYDEGDGIEIDSDTGEIPVNRGDSITVAANNKRTLDESVQLIFHCVGTPLT